ncbi:MAG: hypothetical protein HDT22_06545 [Ruminococcus sp.]|nr:hypothetical protein [Ruminococcus sp.]
MKIFLNFMLVLLLFVNITGCNVADSQETENKINSYKALPLQNLFVDIPENYQKTSSEFYQEYYICDDASIIITEDTREKQYISAYDYSVQALLEYRNMTSSLELLSSDAIPSNQDFTIQTLEFNYTIGDDDDSAKLTCFVGYLTEGSSMYIITCKANTDTYQNHKEEFLSVMHSAVININ